MSVLAKDQYELLANRTARVIEENAELRKQNLQYSQKIDNQDKALLRLRRDRLLHLLREQDFLDLQQSVTLAKEMGCAYKKATRERNKHGYWFRVVTSAVDFNEAEITGETEDIRQRKIRRKKLRREITIKEFPTELYTPPVKTTNDANDADDEDHLLQDGTVATQKKVGKSKKRAAAGISSTTSPTKKLKGRAVLAGSVANHSQNRDEVSTSAAVVEQEPDQTANADTQLSPTHSLLEDTNNVVLPGAENATFPPMENAGERLLDTTPIIDLLNRSSLDSSMSSDCVQPKQRSKKTRKTTSLSSDPPTTRSVSTGK